MANGIAAILGGIVISVLGFKGVFILAGILNLVAAIILFINRNAFAIVY